MTIKEARGYAKEWLNRGASLNNELKQLTDYRERLLKEISGGVSSYTAKEIQSDTVTAQGRADDLKLSYCETCEKIERRFAQFAKINNETLDVIDKLDSATERTLLTGRHVNFKTWGAVLSEVNYSRSNANLIYNKALYKVFGLLYGDNVYFKSDVDKRETKRIDPER